MRILVTGAAGFIGLHVSNRLLDEGHEVFGIDNLNSYYPVSLKQDRLKILSGKVGFIFENLALEDPELIRKVRAYAPDVVVHLAAQAGVRYSLENPAAYGDANLMGTINLLEALKSLAVKHFLFASSSSVYGGNQASPFREIDPADWQVSLYGATKKAGENLIHSYSHLYQMPATAMRFFTVYGPWGRPDMAMAKFTQAILADQPIEVYGEGKMQRDFTYIDDVVEAVFRIMGKPPVVGRPVPGDSLSPVAPFRSVNVGGGQPRQLLDFIKAIENCAGKRADLKMLPMQAGDVTATFAAVYLLQNLVGSAPSIPMEVGVSRYVGWFETYYGHQA